MLNRRGFIGSALVAVASLFTGWRTAGAAAPLPPAEEPCCGLDPGLVSYTATLVMYDNAGNEYGRFTLETYDLTCERSEIVLRAKPANVTADKNALFTWSVEPPV